MNVKHHAHHSSGPTIPHAIRKDEALTFWGNLIGVPVVLGLHFYLPFWVPPTIASVLMNLSYVEASLKANRLRLSTELSVSACLIGVTLIGYFLEIPNLIIGAICCHGFWDMTKHTCGMGVPFFGWYLSACAIFDIGYSAILLYYYVVTLD